jgi:hypothetical protein
MEGEYGGDRIACLPACVHGQAVKRYLKVYSNHLNWGARLESFDPLLNTKCPANLKFFFNDTISREEHITN